MGYYLLKIHDITILDAKKPQEEYTEEELERFYELLSEDIKKAVAESSNDRPFKNE